jgi:1,4-dihydroxy-2-naphthoate octaprenyltransferase
MQQHTQTPLRAWWLAIRPKTLPAAVVPVVVGSAVAFEQGGFVPSAALAALVAALLIQIGTNLANDYFDFQKGSDTAERLGPTRVTQAGLLSAKAVYYGMVLVFAATLLPGLYLVVLGGWPILLIGILSITAGIAYTGGPFPIGYHGLGDVFVFLFFGVVAVVGTHYVQVQAWSWAPWIAAVPVGALAVAILVVNNDRDRDSDARSGKRTLAVRLGPRGTQIEFLALLAVAFLVPLLQWLLGQTSMWVLLSYLALPMAVQVARDFRAAEGAALNGVLAQTARLSLVFAAPYSVGLVVG